MSTSHQEKYYIFVTLGIFTGGVFISSGLFINVENDFKTYFIGLFLLIVLFVCTLQRDGFRSLLRFLLSVKYSYCLLTISLLLSVQGLLQYMGNTSSLHHSLSISGSFGNPAGFAAVQVLLFPTILSLSLLKKQHLPVLLLSNIAVLLTIVTVVLSASRSGITAIVVSVIVVLCVETGLIHYVKRHKWVLVLIAIFVVSIGYFMYKMKVDSANGRLLIWKVCLDMIRDRPLFGYGINGFQTHYMDRQAAYFASHPNSTYAMLADNITHPFNEYLKLAVNFGLVGVVIAVIILTFIILLFLRSDINIRSKGLGAVAGTFIMCLFSYPFHYAAVWLISFTTIMSAIPIQSEKSILLMPGKFVRISSSALIVLFFSIGCRMAYLDMKWAEISKRSLAGNTLKMLPHYAEIKPQMQHKPLFLYNYAAELHYVGMYNESLKIVEECLESFNDYDVQLLLADDLSNTGHITSAIDTYQHASHMIPCRFEPLYGMMGLYLSKGDTLNATRVADQIVKKKIKVPSIRVEQIITSAKLLLDNACKLRSSTPTRPPT